MSNVIHCLEERPLAMTYSPFMGDMPKNARFASIKWTGAPVAVKPSYDSVLTCAKGANPFNPKTLAFTPNPAGEGCYPMTLTVSTVFHHSFAELEVCRLKSLTKDTYCLFHCVTRMLTCNCYRNSVSSLRLGEKAPRAREYLLCSSGSGCLKPARMLKRPSLARMLYL